MKALHLAHDAEPAFLSVREAAKALGVGVGWVQSMIWDGTLPAEKVGKRWRITYEAVEARKRHMEEQDNKWRDVLPKGKK